MLRAVGLAASVTAITKRRLRIPIRPSLRRYAVNLEAVTIYSSLEFSIHLQGRLVHPICLDGLESRWPDFPYERFGVVPLELRASLRLFVVVRYERLPPICPSCE